MNDSFPGITIPIHLANAIAIRDREMPYPSGMVDGPDSYTSGDFCV